MSLNLRETRYLLHVLPGDAPPGDPLPDLPVILDLTHENATPEANQQATPPPRTAPLILRLRPDQIDTEDAANAVSVWQPDGIVLAGEASLAALQAADAALSVIEIESGMAGGRIGIVLEFGATPAALLAGPPLSGGSARLAGLVLDEDALGAALGLPALSAGTGSAPLVSARGHTVLRGAEAGVPAFWSLPRALADPDTIARTGDTVRRDGFAGLVLSGRLQIEALG